MNRTVRLNTILIHQEKVKLLNSSEGEMCKHYFRLANESNNVENDNKLS